MRLNISKYHLIIAAPGFSTLERDGEFWIDKILSELYTGSLPSLSCAEHTLGEGIINGETETEVYIKLRPGRNLLLSETVPGLIERLFNPNSADVLKKASKYGLLGFRPVQNTEFEKWWNQALFQETYVSGAGILEGIKDSQMKVTDTLWLPVWLKLVNFIIAAGIENYFSICPILNRENPKVIENAIAMKQATTKKWVSEGNERIAISFLTQLMKDKTAGRSLAQTKKAAKASLKNFFISIRQVVEVLPGAGTASSPADQARLFNALLSTTRTAVDAFTSNQELLNHFIAERAIWTASMGFNTAFGVWHALKAEKMLRAANLAKPGFFENVGRWFGVISGPTKQQLLTNQAQWIGIFSVVSFSKAAYDGYQVWSTSKMVNFCRETAHLIRQVWLVAAETYTFSQITECDENGVYHFIDIESQARWKEVLRRKLNGEPPESDTEPRFVAQYLVARKDELNEVRERLGKVIKEVYK